MTVFLLVEPMEAVVSSTIEQALELTRQGEEVTILSQSVNAPEKLYRKARLAGVCFIRFETVRIVDDMVEVYDGDFTMQFSTTGLITPLAIPAEPDVPVKKPWAKAPVIDTAKCAFCYSCHRICPHDALRPDYENDAMKCLEDECFGCGNCAAICPAQAIGHEIQPAKIFACENSAYWAVSDKSEVEKIPCGGGVGQEILAAAIQKYGRVVLAVCVDEACKHTVGNRRGCKQAENLGVEYVKASYVMENVLKEVL